VVSPWRPMIIKEGNVPSDDVLSEAPCPCERSDRAVGSPDFGTLRPGAQQQQGMEVQPTQSRGSGVSGKPTCAPPLCSGIGRRRSAAMGRRECRHSPLLVRRRKGAQPPEASFPDDRAVDLAVVFAGDGACLLTPPPPGRRPCLGAGLSRRHPVSSPEPSRLHLRRASGNRGWKAPIGFKISLSTGLA
jgi:hypothetical protein